jgi:hypothetical protein
LRVREIFRYPKRDNLSVASQKIGFCNLLMLDGTIFFESLKVLEFLHFRGT